MGDNCTAISRLKGDFLGTTGVCGTAPQANSPTVSRFSGLG